MHANDSEEDRQWRCQHQSSVLESISQRKDPRANVPLEQMHHGFQVPAVVQFQFVSAIYSRLDAIFNETVWIKTNHRI